MTEDQTYMTHKFSMSADEKWLLCPVCKNKTRIRLREDTELQNFPLYCPKCRQETLINTVPIISLYNSLFVYTKRLEVFRVWYKILSEEQFLYFYIG